MRAGSADMLLSCFSPLMLLPLLLCCRHAFRGAVAARYFLSLRTAHVMRDIIYKIFAFYGAMMIICEFTMPLIFARSYAAAFARHV